MQRTAAFDLLRKIIQNHGSQYNFTFGESEVSHGTPSVLLYNNNQLTFSNIEKVFENISDKEIAGVLQCLVQNMNLCVHRPDGTGSYEKDIRFRENIHSCIRILTSN
jgi:hypothetical protein